MPTSPRILLTAAVLVVGALTVTAPAQAASPMSGDAAAALTQALGDDRTAGHYLDAVSGRVVINVTDATAARQVRAAGAEARMVSRSSAELAQLQTRLDRGVAGTAWSVDPLGNQVVVQADPTVAASTLADLRGAVARSNGAARIEYLPSALRPLISGGDAIYGGPYRCSLGFNVRNGNTYSFLTAGHCTDAASEWFSNSNHSTKLGDRTGTSFPGNDYGIVRYVSSYPLSSISGTAGGQDITSAGNPTVGQSVTRRGSTTGTRSGVVTALNVTVHYSGGGTVRQMIQTTVCAEPGDSGGPLYSGSTALGLTSGGSGNCSSGGTTFYQPVTEALSKYNVAVF